MAPEQPSVLVVVSSSGDYPFLEIEERGQLPTFGEEKIDGVECVWVESVPELSRRWHSKLLDRLLRIVLTGLYRPPCQLDLGSYSYIFGHPGWRRERRQPGWPSNAQHFRFTVNWGHFLAKSYSPESNRNGFSRLLARILALLADGQPSRTGKRVTLNFANSYFLTTWRSFLRYEAVLKLFEFDFVLFTTSTCYVDTVRLRQFVEFLPQRRFCGGHLMKFGTPFIAGNSVLMSRDVVEAVVRHESQYRLDLPDDVSLGLLVTDFDLAEIVEIPTETLPFSPTIPEDLSMLWSDSYLFRCKAEPATRDPELVIDTMHRLHCYITEERGPSTKKQD